MAVNCLSTGNEYIAIPDIVKPSGILDISFLYMLFRSVVELHGTEEEPFLRPEVSVDGNPIDFNAATWQYERYWIPTFDAFQHGLRIKSRVIAPRGHRGFVWMLEMASESDKPLSVDVGWSSFWRDTYQVVNSSKAMRGERFGSVSSLHGGVPCVEFRGTATVFSVAFNPSIPMEYSITSDRDLNKCATKPSDGEVVAADGDGVRCHLASGFALQPGESKTVALYVGVGLEEISAVSSSVDLYRHGWDLLYSEVSTWLDSHTLSVHDKRLEKVLNLNLFYNYFYSQGVTVDSEDLVLVTGRSSKCSASATYRDRDAMLWSMPAVMQTDPARAREMIEYAFTVQQRSVGIQSRFMDGVVLESGFSLDELCSPVRALSLYVRGTRDISILFDRKVQSGVNRILQLLAPRKNPSIALFETVLDPSDELAAYPYVTYDNVMVWRVLQDLSWMYELIHDIDRSDENKQLARQVQRSIMAHTIVDGPFGPMFAWAVDLKGNYVLADDPRGSLQLLSLLEFCASESAAYRNTVKWIRSTENPDMHHVASAAMPECIDIEYPFILSVGNDLLTGNIESAVDFLNRAEMNGGIACELRHENVGCTTMERSFASCAGYLAYALSNALKAKVLGPEPEPTEKLFEPPPPEIRHNIESRRQ